MNHGEYATMLWECFGNENQPKHHNYFALFVEGNRTYWFSMKELENQREIDIKTVLQGIEIQWPKHHAIFVNYIRLKKLRALETV
jgi:hypothetical protein